MGKTFTLSELEQRICDLEHSEAELKQAQEALKNREKYLSTILETTAEGFWVVDARGFIIDVNRAYCSLSGYDREELLGLHIHDIDVEESFEQTEEKIQRIITNGSELFETRHRRKDGTIFPVEISITYLSEEEVFICFSRNFTQRKQAEEALRENEAILAQSQRIAKVGSWKLGLSSNRLVWSDETYRIFGMEPKTFPLNCEVFLDFVHPDDRKSVVTAYGESLRKGKDSYEIEHRIIKKNSKQIRHVYEKCTHNRDEKGNVIESIGTVQDITDRKKVESDLNKSYEFQRAMIATSPVALYSIDAKGNVLTWNESAERIFGWKEEEVIGIPLPIVPGEKLEEFRKLWELVLAGNVFSNLEMMRVKKSGDLIECSLSLAPIYSDTGEIIGIMGALEDITQRKQTEKELKKSEEKFRNLIETINDVIFEVDSRGVITYVSPSGYKFWEGNINNVLGRHFMELIHPEDRELVEKRFQEVQQGIEKPLSYRLITEYREERWVRTHSTAVWKDGEFAGVRGVLMDITAQKEAEAGHLKADKELLDRNRFIETILDHLPIGLAVNYIEEGRASYMNKQFEEIYGWPKDELVDIEQFFEKVYPDPKYREEIKRLIFEDIRSGDPTRMAWEGIETTRKDGKKRIVSAKNIPLFEQNIMISTVQDVTESKNLQEELAQIQKMEAIGRLAGGVAHDLNNLLSPILGYGEMLVEDTFKEDSRRESAEKIVSAGYRARDLVRQLLAFSRKQTLEFKLVDINKVLQDFEKLLRRTVREDIQIDMNLAPELLPIRADIGQIEQVIMNLTVNAQDAMPDGGRLSIESGIVDLDEEYAKKYKMKGGSYILLRVSDTGHGMDAETVERVFEPFYTTKDRGKGTGLGLSTCMES